MRVKSKSTTRHYTTLGVGAARRRRVNDRVRLHKALSHLRLHVRHRPRPVGNKHRGRRAGGADLLEHVEVLRDHHQLHHVSRRRTYPKSQRAAD
eukprot:COSAG06_NODE_15408_length_1072_cov_24.183967_2_plen_94_part_00